MEPKALSWSQPVHSVSIVSPIHRRWSWSVLTFDITIGTAAIVGTSTVSRNVDGVLEEKGCDSDEESGGLHDDRVI